MLSRRGWYVLAYVLVVLFGFSWWDFSGDDGAEPRVWTGGPSATRGKRDAEALADVSSELSSKILLRGEKTAEAWTKEDEELTRDLPFLQRTPAVEATLRLLNEQHRTKHAAAYPGGRLPDGLSAEHQLHLFYTTDCSQHSLWQSLTLEHTWFKVGHRGALSRLVSGCIKEDAAATPHRNYKLLMRSAIDHPRHFIFFGPRINPDAVPGPSGAHVRYPPINRPATVYYWLLMSHPPEEVLGLLDPDMVFLKPLAYPPATLGHPVGQYYDYLVSEDWDKVYDDICVGCPKLTGKADFCPGPPHVMHRKDWGDLTQWWLRYTVEARKKWGKWVAEMAGMSIALSRLGLRTKISKYGMWDRPNAEFNAMMKKHGLSEPAKVEPLRPEAAYLPLGLHPLPAEELPATFHYCFTPEVGRDTYEEQFWNPKPNPSPKPQIRWEEDNGRPLLNYVHWSKYRVPGDWPSGDGAIPKDGTLLDCTQNLLFEYPPLTYMIHHYAPTETDRGWAVMLSNIIPSINSAVVAYRTRYCKGRHPKWQRNIRSAHSQSWSSRWEISYNTTNKNGFTFVDASGKEVREDWESVPFDVPKKR